MYSLIEYKEDGKTVSMDRSVEKDYIEGRYDAISFIRRLSKVLLSGKKKYLMSERCVYPRRATRKQAIRVKRLYYLIGCEGEAPDLVTLKD